MTVRTLSMLRRPVAAIGMGIIVIAVLLSSMASPAGAQWENEALVYEGWKVAKLRVEGLDEEITSDLKPGLALSGKPTLYLSLLDEDISRTSLFLARWGYPYAGVSARFEPATAKNELTVTLVIDRGPPVVVGEVALTGMPEDLEAESRESVTISPGSVFADRTAAETVASLQDVLRKSGYARAVVSMNIEAADSTTVNLGFDVEAGRVNYFRHKIIECDRDDLIKLTAKVADIRRGERYSPRALRDAQTNLRRLDLFRRIRVDTRAVGSDSLDVSVDVASRDPRTLKGGISYWNDEGFRLEAGWMHRNLFARGRGLELSGTLSELLQRGDISTWWPALIAPPTNESILFRAERQNEEAYEQLDVGVEFSSVYYFTIDNNVRTALQISDVTVNRKTSESLEEDVEEGLLTELSVRVNQSSTDDPFNPRSGLSSWTGVKWAPKWSVSDNHYLIWEGWIATYLPVIRGGVLATRLNLGFGAPSGDSDVILPSKRFFSGGSNSMRGFSRRKLGPKDDENAPLGGEAKVEASIEVRQELFWRIWGTLFLDAGQVWYRLDEVALEDLEVAVGPGLWLMTPIGPLRLDAGYRLTYLDTTEPRWAYHIAIGPAY